MDLITKILMHFDDIDLKSKGIQYGIHKTGSIDYIIVLDNGTKVLRDVVNEYNYKDIIAEMLDKLW